MLADIKKTLRPEKKIFEVANEFIKFLNHKNVKFELGGSVAKKTNLKNSSDIDIFARFKSDGNLSDELEKLLKVYNPERIHGSRDYFQVSYKGYCVEIVPVKFISKVKDSENVTDMSPLHVKWANKNLSDKLRDEIRLAKQFCKAQKIYGAESHIKGFSGHVLDILIVYYGSFSNLLKQASVWGDKVIIDIENHKTINSLSKSKTEGPMIIIDPIQKDRNAAAGLALPAFNKFKNLAKQFLEIPDKEMFVVKSIDEKSFKKRHKHVVVLKYLALKGKDDVVGSKINQIISFLRKNTEEFLATEAEWDFEKAFLAFKENKLPKQMEIRGPPKNKLADVKKFKSKHKKIIEKENRVYAIEEREFLSPKKKIKELIKSKYVTSRLESIRC